MKGLKEGDIGRKIVRDKGVKIPSGLESGVEALFPKSIEEKRKELDTLYGKAVSEEDYLQVIEMGNDLRNQMEEAGIPDDEIAEAVYNWLFGRYYWVRKFVRTDTNIRALRASADFFYNSNLGNLSKIKYGYLFAVILSELADDFVSAEKIRNEIRKIAEKGGDIVSILRLINADGLKRDEIRAF